ncbi:MAG: DNA mismatch repair protein MutL [Planctomycetota bacterium]|nr:MAG: DNA mismatch repair protein MutL [Planctomycetota bacterium]
MVIRILPPEVINQIAAGEVIERPFSIVKECLENSIDAGATRIELELEEGGKSLVRIRDNGRGMTPEDLELAFVSHATSKLTSLADLDAIISLGFRGEALASIGSVARVRVLSRPEGSEAGAEIRVDGGKISPVMPAAAPPGTLFEVRDLFYNVPARRRFLRTPQGERARCVDVFTKLALANPELGFVLHGKRELRMEPGEELSVRVQKLFGSKLSEQMLPVQLERGGIVVQGLVGDPDVARRDRTQMQLFLNGRPFQDRGLVRAIQDAFQEYLMGGKFPVAFLFLSMDPARVDVNVHPQKSEVRFVEQRLVFSVLRQAVKEALEGRAKRIFSRGAVSEGATPEAIRPVTGFPELPQGLFGRGAMGGGLSAAPSSPETPLRSPSMLPGDSPLGSGEDAPRVADSSPAFQSPQTPPPRGFVHGTRVHRFLQVKNLYLIFETEDGIAVVDQHALHERVLYEKLLAEYRAGTVKVQKLLIPMLVDLTPADKELLIEYQERFAQAGLLLEDFGGNSIKLEGYPAALRRIDPKALVEGFLEELREEGRPQEPEDVRDRFHHAACRAAIMAGDKLSEDEIAMLIEAASKLEHPDNCPHGRPTVLNFSLNQLERWFQRQL